MVGLFCVLFFLLPFLHLWSMAISILSEPQELSLTGNPIAYHLQSDFGSRGTIIMQVFVEDEFGSGTFIDLPQIAHPCDGNGQAVFRLETLLRDYVSFEFFDLTGDTVVNSRQLSKRYYVAFSDTDEVNVCDLSLQDQEVKYVLNGGIAYEDYPSLSPLLGNDFPILTSFPYLAHRISRQQAAWFSFLHNEPISSHEIVITAYYSDASTSVFNVDLGATAKLQVRHVPFGFSVIDYGETSARYVTHLMIDTGLDVPLKFEVFDTEYHRDAHEVHWGNGFGGMSSTATTCRGARRVSSIPATRTSTSTARFWTCSARDTLS